MVTMVGTWLHGQQDDACCLVVQSSQCDLVGGAEPSSICRASVGGRASPETPLVWSSTPVGVSGEGAEEQASCEGKSFFQTALPRATGKIFMAAPRKIIPFSYHRLFLLFLRAVVVSNCV